MLELVETLGGKPVSMKVCSMPAAASDSSNDIRGYTLS
jgi:hypothetical protein